MMNNRIEMFKKDVEAKKAVKIIAGIDNFDIENVRNIVTAACEAGASAIDISADKDIISMVMDISTIPVFVSSVHPEELLNAVNMGVDAIELGNFDALYRNGMKSFSADEVFNLAKTTVDMLGHRDVYFSVTIPGSIDVNEQIDLARKLEGIGVDLIQTEGYFDSHQSEGVLGLIERAEKTIANTIELSRNIEIPVMTASGINVTTAPLAFAAGASAIGCGSCVNKLNSVISMIAVSKSLVEIAERNAHLVPELV